MIPEAIKKIIKEHGERIAPNDFEKTKLARKYNPETKFYDETIEEITESDLKKWRKIDEIRMDYIDRMEKLFGIKEAEKRTEK